jgi:tripartite-type tricarboxylate transporter receptor subunit TctC
VDKLADAAHKALHTADAIEALRKQGYEALDVGPDEFAAHIRDDVTRWTEVVRTAGLKS